MTLQGLRILLVEDDDDTRDVLTLGLELYGAVVTAVSTTGDALRVIGSCHPDVLVSDVGLPDEDGYGLIRRVRSLPAESGGRVPAVAVTAFTLGDDTRRALRAGFQSHLTKPVDTGVLIGAIASLAKPPDPARKVVDRRCFSRRRAPRTVAVDQRRTERRLSAPGCSTGIMWPELAISR